MKGAMMYWFNDPDEVLAFARFKFDTETVKTADILYYFEKPYKWTPEYEKWREAANASA